MGHAEGLTLSWLKAQVQECTGLAPDEVSLFLGGRPLLADLTFQEPRRSKPQVFGRSGVARFRF